MPAAILHPQLDSVTGERMGALNPLQSAALDDPHEWAAFGTVLPSNLWESQVSVGGMHCVACATALEQVLLAVKGVAAVQVSAASASATLSWSAQTTTPSKWVEAAFARGYQLTPIMDAFASNEIRQEQRLALWRWLVAGFCMMQVMMYAAPAYFSQPGDITPDIVRLLRWASWVLSVPVVIFSAAPFFANAMLDARQRNISMDLPVALGVAVTFFVSTAATFSPDGWWGAEVYFDSLTMFVFFLLTGRLLEQRLRATTAGALGSLMQRIQPSVERLGEQGVFEIVSVRRLKAGDVVRVMPGDAFPSDGHIVLGSTSADESLMTGESRPVVRELGSAVMSGTFNLSSAVNVKVESVGADTQYGQIVSLMHRAGVEKPRLAAVADRVARPFLVMVLLAALGAVLFWWGTDPSKAIMAAVSVLIVTCPCALSLATPSAMLATAGAFARRGVLVRRMQAIEALSKVDTVIFDKTGTLTDATMDLRAVQTRDGISKSIALQLAVSLASDSKHPISRSLVLAAGTLERSWHCLDIKEIAGRGIEGLIPDEPNGRPVTTASGRLRLGSAQFCGLELSSTEVLCVYLADALGWIATFEFDEKLRPDAAQAVSNLCEHGFEVHMLSGDVDESAQRVARSLGIESSRASGLCTPQFKLEKLQFLQRSGRNVLMVGDGLNDGPVLAASNVSVAIGASVPIAQAKSDFVIPGAQLLMLVSMLAGARSTMRVVKQNLWWAAAYNAVCVPLAVAGMLPAWLAGAGMAASSLLVVANAARLARF